MQFRRPKRLKILLIAAAACVAFAVLLAGAFGLAVTRVPAYRVQVQDWINARTGLAVEFQSLSARWRLYGPELKFNQAVLRTPDRTRILATATRGSIGFDVWRAIRDGRLMALRFRLTSPQIGLIRTRDGRIQLLGQNALPEREMRPVALEHLPTGVFDVVDAVVTFRDEITGRGPWSLSGVSFELTRSPGVLGLEGAASLPRSLGRGLKFSAHAQGPLQDYRNLLSTFRIQGASLDLAGWAEVLPDEWPTPQAGAGAMRVEGALRGSTLTRLDAQLDLHDVAAVAPVWTIPLPGPQPMIQPPGSDEKVADELVADEQDAPREGPADMQANAEPVADSAAGTHLQATTQAATQPATQMARSITRYERFALDLRADRVGDEWRVAIGDLDISRPGAPWRARNIEARWSKDAGGLLQASVSADRLVLENLWPLLAYLPQSERLAQVRALDAHGLVEKLRAQFERDASGAPKYSMSASVEKLGFEPVGASPGLTGLNGSLQAGPDGGSGRLSDSRVTFTLPHLFREPLAANVGASEITWHAQDGGWRIASDELHLQNEDGSAVARFSATLAADGSSPLLEIQAQGKNLQVGAASKYIPVGLLSAATEEWFDQAFIAGRAPSAEFVYKGPVRSFPFRNGEGEFLARARVEGAVFSYQPGWAPARQASAEVEFHNQGMQIRASSAAVGALRVSSASADIADFKTSELKIRAAAQGDFRDGLEFLKSSPLGPHLGERFARLQGSGGLRADVRLFLPIKRMAARDIEVVARFANATASLQGLDDAPVHDLTGRLTVRNTLVASADLHGNWLGGPLNVLIEPDGRSESVLTASGAADAEQLTALFKAPPAVRITGDAEWRATTRLSAAGESARLLSTLRLESDTKGVGIALPAPLGKEPQESRELRLDLRFDDETLLARGAFGDVRSILRLRLTPARGWTLDRGGIRADGIAPALPDHSGLRIEGAIDHFVLDEWLALAGEGGEGAPLSDVLRAANVRVRDFEWSGYHWSDVRGLLQTSAGGWRVDVSAPGAQGQILIPENLRGALPVRATLERLTLERAPGEARTQSAQTDPRKLPALQVYIGDLRFEGRELGAVDLKASRTTQGLRIDSFTALSDTLRADARGRWFMTSDGPQSALVARVTSEDVAGALSALDYTPFMQAKYAEIRADIAWPGGFDSELLAHASGAISVRADSGQLINVQPGAGRVLGLFSVAALPRRLALDFSDLTDKGLAFDSVHGDFELRDGAAYTTNLLLQGPAVEIGIAGRTGLAAHDYDQTAVVTGNLGASLPVAGALAGGPALGAALLVFSQVFKEPLKGITRGYYRITGPWDNPTVERIDAAQAEGGKSG